MAMPPFPDLTNNVAFRDLPSAIATHVANFQEYPLPRLPALRPALSASVVLRSRGYLSDRARRKPPAPAQVRTGRDQRAASHCRFNDQDALA